MADPNRDPKTDADMKFRLGTVAMYSEEFRSAVGFFEEVILRIGKKITYQAEKLDKNIPGVQLARMYAV